VTVDIFTEGMSERGKNAMAAFASIFAIGFALLLLVQMTGGLRSYLRYQEVTPVLNLPLWTAFPPILLSLVLLLLAACLTLAASWRAWRVPMAR
jgi:TRAP-type C4-dicarboxylate transport system permease small subunit